MLMDEPFSAVDPVVREQLQNEFLRLQSELGKTIVFVTHDIDEAIKLGDQVAVLRVGGKLAQMATPAELLSRPADPFVAGFVGRDRGYRALGFTPAGSLPLDEAPAVRLGSRLSEARGRTKDGWTLIVDQDNRPQGWLAAGGGDVADDYTAVTPELLNLGGTLAREDGTLREALDAALSSPSGHGVVVDADGRLRGTITAGRVLGQIESQTGGAARAAAEELRQRQRDPAGSGSDPDHAAGRDAPDEAPRPPSKDAEPGSGATAFSPAGT
jgi:osmoprotectant transport system ATP-binding protein